MAYVGAVSLSLWIKPYFRDNLHYVRRAKDLPLLVCTLSVVFPQFGTHKSVLPKESIADLIDRYDLDAIADCDHAAINGNIECVRHFAMPCKIIFPVVSAIATLDLGPVPFRRKPRFDDDVFIDE
eukprot:12116793-Heterocapsa_arctica.AAC.1